MAEVLGLHYAVPWPNRELKSARPFRRSPAYHLLAAAGAGFGSKMGWERANFFAPPGCSPEIEYGWGKQNWQPWSSAEQRAARTAVALFDQTSFSKYLVTGPDAEPALQWLCTADVAVAPGRTVYTGMLNAHGTYEADITVTRLSAEEFLLVSSAASTERDQDHIRRRMPAGLHASLVDVTSQYAVYGVMGPRSRDLLARLTRSDLDDEAFPFGTSREIDLGYATVRATRITYVGELGWELYVPAEFAVGAYEDLVAAGEDLGLANAGYYAIESLRLEKAYRAFGRELTPDYNPAEAGLLFACKLKTDIPFLGRDALERARADGPRRRLVSLVLGGPRRPRRHDLGRRTRPARRRRRRPGHLGRLGRDPRHLRRPGLPPPPRRRPPHPRPHPDRELPGKRRRRPLPRHRDPAPPVRPLRRPPQRPLPGPHPRRSRGLGPRPEAVDDQVEDAGGPGLAAAGRVDPPQHAELQQHVLRVKPGLSDPSAAPASSRTAMARTNGS